MTVRSDCRCFALAACALLAIAGVSASCGSDSAELVGDGSVDGMNADPDSGADDTDAGPQGCAPYHTECNGQCIPTSVDPQNCGGCGVTCNSPQVCVGGGCADDCPEGLEPCAGTCVDLKTDSAHCNSCDFACTAGNGCVDGTCHPLVPVDPPPAQCDGGGPPLDIDTPEGPECSGDIAETTFRWAVCSCQDVELFNPLITDAYDSNAGPYVPGGLGGGIGLNGDFTNTSTSEISGSLWASSPTGGVLVSNQTDILQELHTGGPLNVGNPFSVALDAFVVGDITTSDTIDIAGTLFQPAQAERTGSISFGALSIGPVVVPPPCDCDPGELIPVIDIVTARRPPQNDNALIGLDPDVLLDPGVPTRLDLSCGHYYLSGIDTNAPLVISASGRVALYIDGDVNTGNPLAFVVGPAGELNVFIAGGLTTSAKLTVGSPSYPALSRVFLGGVGTSFSLTIDAAIGGFIYGAVGTLDASNPVEVYGGIIAGDFRNSGSTTIHYDRQVLESGDVCPPDGPACDSCQDCGNQACVNGTCGECTTSADCCAPLVCSEGECVIVVD